jgi:hypothetical protein
MALTTNLGKVATATTAASGATNKVTALATGIVDALARELGKTGAMTPNMQNKLADARANIVANIATLQTAVGL